MNFFKIKRFCRVFRVFLGLALIGTGYITGNYWFYLGVIPLLVGIFNFCPLCIFSKKCDLPNLGSN
ncbi:MAG: DUF2892 domain-containing protein [Sulfurimonas sp.]|nr:DUF2892 domain-containing protein [Sulfurimonas sp.]